MRVLVSLVLGLCVSLLGVSLVQAFSAVKDGPKQVDQTAFVSFDEAAGGMNYKVTPPNIYPKHIELFFDQTRLRLVAEFPNGVRVDLPYEFEIGYDFDGEVHWEKGTNKYSLTQYDLTGDGVDEILFAVIAPDDEIMSKVEVNVLRYHPPLEVADLSSAENWELAASLKAIGVIGEVDIVLEGNSIRIPRNHRGFYYELKWLKGKFWETGNS